jgi:hypothetical protein
MWTKNTTTKEFSMCTKMGINKNKPEIKFKRKRKPIMDEKWMVIYE